MMRLKKRRISVKIMPLSPSNICGHRTASSYKGYLEPLVLPHDVRQASKGTFLTIWIYF
jgi:hypothetical protein